MTTDGTVYSITTVKLIGFTAITLLCIVYLGMKIWSFTFRKRPSRERHVRVECWFCQEATSVPSGSENCFDCLECGQYNGFAKDGNYNRAIPAQYSEELNEWHSGAVQQESQLFVTKPNPLCDVCQTNQELKVQQLAAFVPTHEKNFDPEVTEYAQYLEEAYRLCPACDSDVCNELNVQDTEIRSKLLGQGLHLTVTGTMKEPVVSQVQIDHITLVSLMRILSVTAASLIFLAELSHIISPFYQEEQINTLLSKVPAFIARLGSRSLTVSLVGLVLCVISSLVAGKYRLTYLDCACPLLWMLYMGISITLPSSSSSSSSSVVDVVLQRLLPWVSADIIPLLSSTCLLLSSIKHALLSRAGTTKKVFTNRFSKTSNSTPSLHRDPIQEEAPKQLPSTSAETVSTPLSQSLQADGEIKRILLDQDIGGLSLGPPPMARPKNKDVWTVHTPPTSRPATPLSEERPSSREFRPVISPATFNPSGMKRTASQSSFASSFCGAFASVLPQERRFLSSREPFIDSGRGSSVHTFADGSSDGSLPLGMSANKQENSVRSPVIHKRYTQGWMSFLLPCALGFSLGLNVAVVVYFMYGR